MKREILTFSNKISRELSKPERKFTADITYGMLAYLSGVLFWVGICKCNDGGQGAVYMGEKYMDDSMMNFERTGGESAHTSGGTF